MPPSTSSSGRAEFEIELRSGQDGFEARVLTAPGGRRSAPFVPPFAGAGLQVLLETLERRVCSGARVPRDLLSKAYGQAAIGPYAPADLGDRHASRPTITACAPKPIGGLLFESLFPEPIKVGFREALASCGTGAAQGLLLRLSFDRREDFAPLAILPWELLFDGQQFLALHRRTPVVRSHNQPTILKTIATDELRVLLVDSRPSDLAVLDTELEAKRITAALERHPKIRVIHFRRPDSRTLRQRLLDEHCHVLHFMGHGNLRDGLGREMVLWFEGDRGHAEPVSGELFGELVKDLPELRLVVLNSCWGGALPRRRGQDPFSGVAATLMVRGVAAVVAMQFPISDRAAIAFAEAFYRRLAADDSLSEAVTEGRIAIKCEDEDGLEWATPALFLSGSDRVFEVRSARRHPNSRQQAAHEHADAAHPLGSGVHPPAPAQAGQSLPARPTPLRLAVRSFQGFRSMDEPDAAPDEVLDLKGFFDGRFIRRHEAWQGEIFPRLREFLLHHAAARRPLILDFAAHMTIAFAAGYCLEAKSGLDITLLQRGQRGTTAWRAEPGPSRQGPLWIGEADRPRGAAGADVALAASVTWPIAEDVERYLEIAALPVRRLFPMTLYPQTGPREVADGHHALELAQELVLAVRGGRTVEERAAVLHLFCAAPNALVFYLGQLGRSLGAVQLYEHDYESGRSGAYLPSLRLPVPLPALGGTSA